MTSQLEPHLADVAWTERVACQAGAGLARTVARQPLDSFCGDEPYTYGESTVRAVLTSELDHALNVPVDIRTPVEVEVEWDLDEPLRFRRTKTGRGYASKAYTDIYIQTPQIGFRRLGEPTDQDDGSLTNGPHWLPIEIKYLKPTEFQTKTEKGQKRSSYQKLNSTHYWELKKRKKTDDIERGVHAWKALEEMTESAVGPRAYWDAVKNLVLHFDKDGRTPVARAQHTGETQLAAYAGAVQNDHPEAPDPLLGLSVMLLGRHFVLVDLWAYSARRDDITRSRPRVASRLISRFAILMNPVCPEFPAAVARILPTASATCGTTSTSDDDEELVARTKKLSLEDKRTRRGRRR